MSDRRVPGSGEPRDDRDPRTGDPWADMPALTDVTNRLASYLELSDADPSPAFSDRVMAALEAEPPPRRGLLASIVASSGRARRGLQLAAVASILLLAVAGTIAGGQLAGMLRQSPSPGATRSVTPSPSATPTALPTPSPSPELSSSAMPGVSAEASGSGTEGGGSGGSSAPPTAEPSSGQNEGKGGGSPTPRPSPSASEDH